MLLLLFEDTCAIEKMGVTINLRIFLHRHKGKRCHGQGLMSYGKHPNEWSKCSKEDFTRHFNSEKNHWCLGKGKESETTCPHL